VKTKRKPPATHAEIVTAVTENFRCFGGGRASGSEFNPLVSALSDGPPVFAAGVSVDDVVRFVAKRIEGKP
jgi:hypothetical protein